MKVLVSGAGGFLGRFVVNRLLRDGHTVRAIIRPHSAVPKYSNDVEIFYGDLRTSADLQLAFHDVDVVVHVAAATSGTEDTQFASTVVGTERFLEAMTQSSAKRLIHISSFVVYDWTVAGGSIDESTPLLGRPYDMGPYTIAKVWQERVVKRIAARSALGLTILRPGFVWGPEHAEIAGMGRRFGSAYLLIGPFTRLPLSHVENCADCIARAVQCDAAIGEAFNVVDGDDVRVWKYVWEYIRRSSQKGIMLPVPYSLGFGVAKLAQWTSRVVFGERARLPSILTPKRFQSQFKPLRFTNQKLQMVLRWSPPLSFEQCLSATYESATQVE